MDNRPEEGAVLGAKARVAMCRVSCVRVCLQVPGHSRHRLLGLCS